MYGTSLSLSRLRGAYDDYDHLGHPWPKSSWPAPNSTEPNARNAGASSGKTMANSHSTTPGRRNRYSRASTTSVTQLLSDSCSSLLQKLTTRVRGPSATFERHIHNQALTLAPTSPPPPVNPNNNNVNANNSSYSSTRHRLEDKYSAVLDRIYGRKRDPERTIEPSVGRGLAKSATTANVFLTEKAYPYVHVNNVREKTPYRNEGKTSKHHKQQYPEPPYSYLDRDSAYRIRHKSNHSDLRPRRSAKPARTGKSESERTNLKLCPVEIPMVEDHHRKPTVNVCSPAPLAIDEDATPTPSVPDPISEREAKRKEIQSLIMKYSALDEAYNKTGGNTATPAVHQSATAAIAQKYQSRLAPAVSSGRV